MTTLLEALNNVKQEDLDEVNKRIDLLKNELGSMTELKKVLEIKLNITPSVSDRMKAMRAARGTQAKSNTADSSVEPHSGGMTATERHRERIREYIMANGPAKRTTIINACDVPMGSSTAVFNHPMFCETSRGVELTRDFK